MLYLFAISKKWAFRICIGYGGVGDHIFSQIRAEVGRFHDFGLYVHSSYGYSNPMGYQTSDFRLLWTIPPNPQH